MKTRVGRAVLKHNSKRMVQLNEALVGLARELKDLNASLAAEPRYNSYEDPSELQRLLDRVRTNKAEHDKLQEEINLLVDLERYL